MLKTSKSMKRVTREQLNKNLPRLALRRKMGMKQFSGFAVTEMDRCHGGGHFQLFAEAPFKHLHDL